MPPPDFDALSDGSELTGEESTSDHQDMPSAPHTPRKRRRTVRAVQDDDEDDEDQVADQLEDEDEVDDLEEEEDGDELDEDDEDYDAPSTSARTSSRASTRSKAAASTPKRASRASTRITTATAAATPPQASAGKKSLRVKLTRTPAKEESSPAPSKPGRPSRAAPAAPTPPARRPKDASKVKWKPKAKGKHSSDEDEIPVPSDDELRDEDDIDISRAPTEALSGSDDDDGSASEPDEATAAEMQAIIGKTARQLARESGVESEHLELPMFDPNRKKKLTENEIALRRSETARKRKNQVEKKLEDDKVETINRLLKKQVGRSRNKLPRAGSPEDSDEEAEAQRKRGREEMSRKALKEMPAPFYRFIDKAEGKILAVPTGAPLVQEVWGSNYVEVNQALIQELDAPPNSEGLKEKAKLLQEKARKRLEEQAEQWKHDQELEKIWGQEGLYEYKLRTALGQTRKEWIGSRRPPTPEAEKQSTEEDKEEEEQEQEDAEERAEDTPEQMDEDESK